MCLSCGCCLPNDDHGNTANITYTDLLKAMVAGKVPSPAQTIQNMVDCYQKMCDARTSDISYDDDDGKMDADKGDGPGTVPNDPDYLRNNTQYINRPGGM